MNAPQQAATPVIEQPPAPTPAPAPPAAPATVSPALAPAAPGSATYVVGVPRTAQELQALRSRREELSNQLQSATSRRNQLANRLKTAEGADKVGIEQRLQFLDQRILQLETDIAVSGQQVAAAPSNLLSSSQAPFVGARGRGPRDFAERGMVAVGSLFTLLVFAPLAFAAARLMWRRATRPDDSPREAETVQRLSRLETAVDAIAIEMERVAEGQRFLTRILAEPGALPSSSMGDQSLDPVTRDMAAHRR